MYVNPTGANPTGKIYSLERKKRIYELCCLKDILILEDDPYFYMQFSDHRVPSFFSMDVEGRVLRMDSLSKILSSGIRLGFISGPKPLVERIMLHMQVSVVHASSLSQVITSELLGAWQEEGFFKHLDNVRDFYRKRRDVMVAAADKHLKGKRG